MISRVKGWKLQRKGTGMERKRRLNLIDLEMDQKFNSLSEVQLQGVLRQIVELTFWDAEESKWDSDKELDSDTLGELVNILHLGGLSPVTE